MKAILEPIHKDHIVMFSLNAGVEVGPRPPGVPIGQLRFDGENVVDLADPSVTEMWVRWMNEAWWLHVIPLPGTQLVTMTWQERKRLVEDPPGTYKVLSQAEWDQSQTDEATDQADNRSLKQEVAALVENMTYQKIGQRIDNAWGDLTTAQQRAAMKSDLKNALRILLYLAKKELK